MDRDSGRVLCLNNVRRVAEVSSGAANDLLECGWVLHDIQFNPQGERQTYYIMLCMEEPRCPSCEAEAKIEVSDQGDRVRFVCTRECGFSEIERDVAVS